MIRVLVVDDSLFMRTLIKDMLEKDPEFQVVGTAIDGLDALRKIRDLSPDIMTLDIEMPRLDGLSVLQKRSDCPRFPKTLMLSSLTTTGGEMTRKAMELGADDFMLKPRDVRGVRGIDRELRDKLKNLITITYPGKKQTPRQKIASRAVFIGSSAGGPPMLDILLSSITAPLDAAMVITQHMPEGGFTASLATRLNRVSCMPVKESENGDHLMEGTVYVSKAGYHSVITGLMNDRGRRGGMIVHAKSAPVHSVRPAVDKTFSTGATVFGDQCVAAILSGMGNDGGEGMAAIRKSGGKTIVCREEDCLVWGMARSAITRDGVEMVLPLGEIGGQIVKMLEGMQNNVRS